MSRIKHLRTALLHSILLGMLTAGPHAEASGYRPDFDTAFAEADLIVEGRVTDAFYPKVKGWKQFWKATQDQGMLYRMTVDNVIKGTPIPGDTITLWDPYDMSTAGWHIEEGTNYLLYLVATSPSEYQQRAFEFTTTNLYWMIRGKTIGSESYEAESFSLNITRHMPDKQKLETFQTILQTETNRDLLHFVITHWPRPLTSNDVALLNTAAIEFSDDAYIASYAIELLTEEGHHFSDKEILLLLQKGRQHQREELLPHIHPENIDLLKKEILSWIQEQGVFMSNEMDAIKTLAKFAPEYLKEKLRTCDWPFSTLIPCYTELGINGRDVGKESFPPEILKINPYLLGFIGDIYEGEYFHARLAMERQDDHPEWRSAIPLITPLLNQEDSAVRRFAVALLRTLGADVKRNGTQLTYTPHEAPRPCPVSIELQSTPPYRLGKPINLSITITALEDDLWISNQPKPAWTVENDEQSSHFGGLYNWGETDDYSRANITHLNKGDTIDLKYNIGQDIDQPGLTTIHLKETFYMNGSTFNIDAWTGVVFSKPITFSVKE